MIKSLIQFLLIGTVALAANPDPSNNFKFGDGQASNKNLTFNRGGSNPQIRWDEGSSLLKFSNDGATFTPFASGSDSSVDVQNVGLSATVSANNLTVSLKTKALGFPSSSDAVKVAFRSSTATTGTYIVTSIVSAVSITANSGATFSCSSSVDCYIYVYLQYNSGTPELCLSGIRGFDEGSLYTTTTVSGSSTANGILYCSTGRSTQPIKFIARVKVNEATSGVYASSPTEVSVLPTDVHQLGLYSMLTYPSAPSAQWTIAGSTSYVDFPADTNQSTPTVTGGCVAPGTKLPEIDCNNMPVGTYRVTAETRLGDSAAGANCIERLTDGTTQLAAMYGSFDSGGNEIYPGTLVGYITYNTPANHIFKMQGACDTGQTRIKNNSSTVGSPGDYDFKIIIEKIQ